MQLPPEYTVLVTLVIVDMRRVYILYVIQSSFYVQDAAMWATPGCKHPVAGLEMCQQAMAQAPARVAAVRLAQLAQDQAQATTLDLDLAMVTKVAVDRQVDRLAAHLA